MKSSEAWLEINYHFNSSSQRTEKTWWCGCGSVSYYNCLYLSAEDWSLTSHLSVSSSRWFLIYKSLIDMDQPGQGHPSVSQYPAPVSAQTLKHQKIIINPHSQKPSPYLKKSQDVVIYEPSHLANKTVFAIHFLVYTGGLDTKICWVASLCNKTRNCSTLSYKM